MLFVITQPKSTAEQPEEIVPSSVIDANDLNTSQKPEKRIRAGVGKESSVISLLDSSEKRSRKLEQDNNTVLVQQEGIYSNHDDNNERKRQKKLNDEDQFHDVIDLT